MSPITYLRAARKHWLTVAMLTMVGVLVSCLGVWRQGTRYESDVRVQVTFVAWPGQLPAPGAALLQQHIVKNYALMANSERVTRPLIDQLSLPYSPGELAGHIRALSPVGSSIIQIAVDDTSPERARDVGNAVARQLAAIANAATPSPELASSPKIEVLVPASTPDRPVRVWWQLRVLAGALAGLSLGIGTATFRHLLELAGDRPGAWLARRWSVLSTGVRAVGSRANARLRGLI
jgi:capsular polysaccharide biosynthesis protein